MHYGIRTQVDLSRKIEKEYDVAIGFMEGWSTHFVASNKVKAYKKFVWVHPQYHSCFLIPEIDKKAFNKVCGISLVDKKCKEQFIKYFPKFQNKVNIIPNILSEKFVLEKANEEIKYNFQDKINICTICRIDIHVKGLDRLINVIKKLKTENLCNNIIWHVIGDGNEFSVFERKIIENKLNDVVILHGMKKNPYPYLVRMDAFVLMSRYEGKPVSVTEAEILNVPCLVTEYSAASSQIKNYYNGIIMKNSEAEIYETIKKIIEEPNILKLLKTNLLYDHYGNECDIELFYKMIDSD